MSFFRLVDDGDSPRFAAFRTSRIHLLTCECVICYNSNSFKLVAVPCVALIVTNIAFSYLFVKWDPFHDLNKVQICDTHTVRRLQTRSRYCVICLGASSESI